MNEDKNPVTVETAEKAEKKNTRPKERVSPRALAIVIGGVFIFFGIIFMLIFGVNWGLNDKKKEILYTDTWGEGHELKRMPEDWAFAITHDAFFLKPR